MHRHAGESGGQVHARHFRGGRGAISKDAYPDIEGFFEDIAAAYRDELKQLGAAGCRYVQLDDTNLAYLCDPVLRAGAKARGDDPDALPLAYAARGLMVGLDSVDLGAVAIAALVLIVTAVAATLAPARRGARLDPVAALRTE